MDRVIGLRALRVKGDVEVAAERPGDPSLRNLLSPLIPPSLFPQPRGFLPLPPPPLIDFAGSFYRDCVGDH